MKNMLLFSALVIFALSCFQTENKESDNQAETIDVSTNTAVPDQKVARRLNYFDRFFFQKKTELVLSETQKEKLRPVIKQKMEALEKIGIKNLQSKQERAHIRDSIRLSWNPAIEVHLTSEQIAARRLKLKIGSKQ